MIRFAKKHDLPLDFVSWHHFGRPIGAIAEARSAYLAEWRKVGFDGEPEWLITEWSCPGRGTPYANTAFADLMLAFRDAGVDVQTMACWEDFHAKPNPKSFAPLGLMTQQGHKKSHFHVHALFDRLVRESAGIALRRDESGRTLVISRKPDGLYDLLVWDKRGAARLKAAWAVLQAAGFDRQAAARTYRIGDRMERAIAAGEAPAKKWQRAFEKARRAYEDHPIQTRRLVLEFTGVKAIEVESAEVVRTTYDAHHPVAVVGTTLSCALPPQSVLRLVLRVHD